MFTKLRIQFICAASAAVIVILISVIGILNASRYASTQAQIENVLSLLTKNGGVFPEDEEKVEFDLGLKTTKDGILQYRYFSAWISIEGTIDALVTDHIASLDDTQIQAYVVQIWSAGIGKGTLRTDDDQIFSYLLTYDEESEQYLIVALDSTRYITERNEFISVSIFLFIGSLAFFITLLSIFSGKVIEPFIENYKNQRRFITNASHELKTPLAIISANTELSELISGENEWSKSTKDQIARLTNLINSLVILSRLEEQPDITLTDLDFSYITKDAAEDFKGPVTKEGKVFSLEVQPDIRVKAEEKSLFELVTILVDNANKYCDDSGKVCVKLTKTGTAIKRAKLEVSNTYVAGKGVDYSKFFDRFYREDASHNSKKSGFGIGLSIAEGITRRFKGKIYVSYREDTITFTVVI